MLKALSSGLPVICLDLGGPGQIVDETCGIVISTSDKTESDLVSEIAEAIIRLQRDPELLNMLSDGALKRASEFRWEDTVERTYSQIEDIVSASKASELPQNL